MECGGVLCDKMLGNVGTAMCTHVITPVHCNQMFNKVLCYN